jgi:transposase
MASCFLPTKRPVRGALSVGEKVIILNVHDALIHQNPSSTVDNVVSLCSEMTGIGKSTIYRLLKERKAGGGSVSAPKASTGRKKIVIDEDFKITIRRKVHNFYFDKEIPTLDKILSAINADDTIPNIKRDKLWKVLKELNFSFEKHNRNCYLIENEEIVCWRRNYLRSVKKFREEGRKIYYLDETWLNEGHCVVKMWQDKNVTSHRQAFLEGWSTGLKQPTGKGRRLIITHIGSDSGFVNGGLMCFESSKTGDYHEDMTADVFEEYFQQMLDLIPTGSVIVLDNAPYHSRLSEKLPTTAWKKADIMEWLRSKNISFQSDMVKKELLYIASLHKSLYKKHVVDEMAAKRGILLLRLPPYHCQLNPIELIWAHVKGDVARKNTSYKLSDVKNLLHNALASITSEDWKKCVDHVLHEEMKLWDVDHIIEQTIEPIIITVDEDDDSSDEFENTM